MPTLNEFKDHALGLMKAKGFPIAEEVGIEVDEKLPFMGYTSEKNGKRVIVVSKWAHDSGMLMGLLIHEMSHIYRIETKHPSHNDALQNKAVNMLIGNKKLLSYQHEILFNIINSIMDLYADDIFFEVMKGRTTTHADFFLSWIHQPVSGSLAKRQWTNAGYMVSAAFAQANLERHNVPDTDEQIKKGIEEFFSKSSPEISAKFPYFKNVMVHLPEKITEEEFGKLLVDYLKNFLSLVTSK
jgi:hypothetical protein